MSDTIDNKVVSMKFDNKQFEQNVAQTLSSLQKLQASLNATGASKGISDLQKSADNFNMDKMGRGIDGISAKFIALSTVAITALANITNRAVDAGIRFAKSFTVDPLVAGFQEYELKMGSIQTILANTAKDGTKLNDVTKALDELNEYADKTIYNFGAMTKNIGLFTNAGIKLEDAVAMIKGFSNEAAVSGTNAEMAAAAAYQLSQALNAGVIRLMDWRSLQNVGMGNANMQDGLIEIASAMGKFNEKTGTAEETAKSFNASLEKGWLTADVMTNYLKIQAGELSKEQMKNLGLTEAQIKAFSEQQQRAEDAATKVRTWTQLVGTIKESIGSGWAETFSILIGDFDEATNLFTKVNDTIGPIINGFATFRNNLLKDWVKEGGRTKLLEGIANVWNAIFRIVTAVKSAFQEVFPPATGKTLVTITEAFANFTEKLKMGAPQLYFVKELFATLFGILDLGLRIVKGVFGVVGKIISVLFSSAGSIDGFSGSLGGMLNKFNDVVSSGEKITEFFEKLQGVVENVLSPIVESIKQVAAGFGALLSGRPQEFFARLQLALYALGPITDRFKEALGKLSGVFSNVLKRIKDFFENLNAPSLQPLIDFVDKLREKFEELKNRFSLKPKLDLSGLRGGDKVVNKLKGSSSGLQKVWESIVNSFKSAKTTVGPALEKIGEVLSAIAGKFIEWVKGADFQDVLAVINTVFLIMLYRTIKRYVSTLEELAQSFTGIMDQVSSGLKTLERDVKANIILKIAIAIGILAVSLWLLSKIPLVGLATGLGAMAIMFTLLNRSMKQLVETVDKAKNINSGKMLAVGAAMVLLATAIGQLSVAAKILGSMSFADLAQGLGAVGALIAGVFGFMKAAGKSKVSGPQMLAMGAALILMATAIQMLAVTVAILGRLDQTKLSQGFGTLAALIVAISALSVVLSKAGPFAVKGAIGALIIVGAIQLLAGVVRTLGQIPEDQIKRALITIAALVGGLGVFFGTFTGPQAIAAATVGGAIAAAAVGIKILADAFVQVSKVPWQDGLKAIGALAALSLVLAAFGAVGTVFGFGLMAIGAAFFLIGAGMLAMGIGATMLTGALAALALVGAPAVVVLMAVLQGVLQLIPLFAQQLALGVVAFATALGDAGPELIDAVSKLIDVFLESLRKNLPKIEEIFGLLITSGLRIFDENTPKIIKSGANFVVNLLRGIRDRARDLGSASGEIIAEFIRGIGDGAGEIVEAGVSTLLTFMWGLQENMNTLIDTGASVVITFLDGLAKTIDERSEEFYNAGWDIIFEIIQGMLGGLLEGPRRVAEGAANLAWSAINRVREILGINSPSRVFMEIGRNVNEGFAVGIRQSTPEIRQAFKDLNEELKTAIQDANDTIDRETKNRAQLMAAEEPDYDAIRESTRAIDEAIQVRDRSRKARLVLQRDLKDERQELINLRKSYEAVTERLIDAKDKLKSLKEEKVQKQDELFNQYNKLPDISKTMGLQGYIRDTKKITEANNKYKQSLDKLRKLGLDDASYKKLLAEGADAQPLVNQLISGGKDAVSEFNKVNKNLEASAKSLADKAASELYDAGIQAARGLVNGLKENQRDLRVEMNKLATYMVNSIKKALGIKSPSREFMEIAKFSVMGLVKGFQDGKDAAENAAAGLGDGTLSRMRDIFNKIRDEAEAGIETQPVIAPVVDLTDFKKSVKEMQKAEMPDLNVDASIRSARDAARLRRAYSDFDAAGAKEIVQQVVFQQTNNSPEALSNAEIYRQSKTLLSQIK